MMRFRDGVPRLGKMSILCFSAVCCLWLFTLAPLPGADGAQTPRIVAMSPPNGATDVSPTVTELRVTFDMPMSPSFSWCGGGDNFPEVSPGKRAHWTPDRQTCVFPVRLKPNWQYGLSINAPSFQGFRSTDGIPVQPVAYKFSTGAAPAGYVPPPTAPEEAAKEFSPFQMDLRDIYGRKIESADYAGVPLFLEFGACW
jgi:hypothetical protein